jgi:GNAT superfamily N-acetyltransferase
MPSDIEIRKINADALPDIMNLYRVLRPDWQPRQGCEAQLNTHPTYGAYTAEGKMVGFIYSYFFAPDILELANIYIDDTQRGKNIGSRLLHAFEDDVRKSAFNAVLLFNSAGYETTTQKISAAPFYLKHGYQNIATTEQTKIFFKDLSI